MYQTLTSSYIRNIFVAFLFIFLNGEMYGQEQPDSLAAADINESFYDDEEIESWLPDTIFTSITGLTYPADSFETRHIPNSIIDSLKKDEAFWYTELAKNAPQKKAIKENDPGFLYNLVNQQWFKTLVWIIIIVGFLFVLVWYLASSNISLFRTAPKSIDQDSDHMATNIFEINYKTEIEKALNSENYRLATRLMFLQLLKNLDENNIINYQQDLTNLDYRMQLYGTHYAPDFNDLVKFYEYSWYGKWQPGANQFMLIRNKFESFNGQLSKA